MNQQAHTDTIILYTDKHGNVELHADIKKDTIWATQAQIARLFSVNAQAITKHLNNIYKEKELTKHSTCSKMEQVQLEGGRSVKRDLEFYNLDAIIAVGYRVNSKKATQFRIWATNILRNYLTQGYAIHHQRLATSPERIEGLHEAVNLLESKKYKGKVKGKIILKVVKELEEDERFGE